MTVEGQLERRELLRDERAASATRVEDTAGRRASWFAIFGGATLALATSILLGLLGFAIGMSTVDPTAESPSLGTFGTAAGVWWLASGIVALFVGGWVTARLSGLFARPQTVTHGLVTWGAFTILSLVLMAYATTAVLTGAFRVVGSAGSVLAGGAQAVVQAMPDQLPADLPFVGQGDAVNVTWDDVRTEATQLLAQTERAQLQPENLEQDARDVGEQLQQAATAPTQAAADAELEAALRDLQSAARETVQAADQQAVVNVLTARTDMDEAQARQLVERWSQRFTDAWQGARQAVSNAAQDVRQTATQVAEDASNAMAASAWWSFVYLLATALAAAGGAVAGTPRRERTAETTRRAAPPPPPVGRPIPPQHTPPHN